MFLLLSINIVLNIIVISKRTVIARVTVKHQDHYHHQHPVVCCCADHISVQPICLSGIARRASWSISHSLKIKMKMGTMKTKMMKPSLKVTTFFFVAGNRSLDFFTHILQAINSYKSKRRNVFERKDPAQWTVVLKRAWYLSLISMKVWGILSNITGSSCHQRASPAFHFSPAPHPALGGAIWGEECVKVVSTSLSLPTTTSPKIQANLHRITVTEMKQLFVESL